MAESQSKCTEGGYCQYKLTSIQLRGAEAVVCKDCGSLLSVDRDNPTLCPEDSPHEPTELEVSAIHG